MLAKAKTYYIKTFGCQANEADSEKIASFLDQAGLRESREIKRADLVVINSCAVRQSAEDRAIGLVHNLSQKTKRPIIIVSGCFLYHNKKYLYGKLGQKVDHFIRTAFWPEFIARYWRVKVEQDRVKRKTTNPVYVPIMEGCNNFCTYCVVPHARGREKSFLPKKIICQVNQAIISGYQDILLLGQNVNSYGKDLKEKDLVFLRKETKFGTPFAALLAKLNDLKGLKKISFLTSNPQDLDDDIIRALTLSRVDRQLHLPVQSGDDDMLKIMNRKYTALQYIKLVKKIKKTIPEIKISTDIIVGFPGETEEQFQNTVSLCREINFNKAYINKYSPRPQTEAAKLEDDVSWSEKKRRWQILDQLING
ncbi:MAG: MiaB/RimO family radical SAM methylthiotransferase [Candidatus Shapirobacteria bacterium]|nr:MiaB/RimO family radical SAM methylthiotransferase [Candidatus Shapirobacteria bacterium]